MLIDSDDERLERYVADHIDPEPPGLAALNRAVNTRLLYSRMCSGHLQGRLLKMFAAMINPRRVLEIGTYAGYSALCFAEGIADDAEVHTIEIDDEMEDFISDALRNSPVGHKVTLHIGDAAEIIPALGGPWDLVFIDGNKRHYSRYYELVMPLIPSGAYILADNTLWDGKVADMERYHDPQTAGVAEFNDMVAADSRVEKVIVPLRDGLTIIRKL